jgi:hypothetical protein
VLARFRAGLASGIGVAGMRQRLAELGFRCANRRQWICGSSQNRPWLPAIRMTPRPSNAINAIQPPYLSCEVVSLAVPSQPASQEPKAAAAVSHAPERFST